jgi:AraC family ethanolamine operon transcriptional activator
VFRSRRGVIPDRTWSVSERPANSSISEHTVAVGVHSNAFVSQVSDAADIEGVLDPCECIQLTPGSFFGKVIAIPTGAVRLVRQECNRGIQLRRKIQNGKLLIGYNNGAGSVLEHGRAWSPDDMLVVRDSDVDLNALDRMDLIWLEIDLTALSELERQAFLRSVEPRNALASFGNATATTDVRSYLMAMLEIGAGDSTFFNSEPMRRHIEMVVLTRVSRALDSAHANGLGKKREREAFGLVQLVERFMWENVDEPLTLSRICESTNCRMRSLIYSFKESFGFGPITYLKILRLNAAHRRLKETRGSVRIFDVAADFGFWHMGHFSADYKRMFGSTASETVAAAACIEPKQRPRICR